MGINRYLYRPNGVVPALLSMYSFALGIWCNAFTKSMQEKQYSNWIVVRNLECEGLDVCLALSGRLIVCNPPSFFFNMWSNDAYMLLHFRM